MEACERAKRRKESLAGAKYLLCVRVLIASPRLVEDIPGCPYQHKKQKKKLTAFESPMRARTVRLGYREHTSLHSTQLTNQLENRSEK